MQNKKCSHSNMQYSSYLLLKYCGNVFPGFLERLKCQIVNMCKYIAIVLYALLL